MTIDTHMHFYDGGWPAGAYQAVTEGQLLDIMDRHDIEQAWISSMTSLVRDCRNGNNRLYNLVRNNNRLLPFYTVNPNEPLEDVENELKRCIFDMSCKGIKLHPWLQAFSISYAAVHKISEMCCDYEIPVLFHDGTPPYSDSLQIASLAELYPDLRIVLGHSGLLDLYENAISAAVRHKNIYLEITASPPGDIEKIVQRVDNGKLMYGTDFFGIDSFASQIQNSQSAVECSNIPEKTKEMIFYSNARRFMT